MRAIAAEELLVVLFSSGLCRCYTQRTHTHSLIHSLAHSPTYRSSTDNIATTIESGTLVYSFDRLRVKNLYYNAVRASRASRSTAPPIERAHLRCICACAHLPMQASGSLVTVSSHSRVHAICHVFPLATIRVRSSDRRLAARRSTIG